MKIEALALFAIIAISACVNVTTTVLPPDIVIIQTVNTIPTPPINAGDQFSLSFEVKNQDTINEVSDVNVQLFDWGLCSPQSTSFTPTDWTGSDVIYRDFGAFVPGQTEFIEWTFQAPTNDQIGRLQTTCPIRFKANYNFAASSQIDVQAISSDRLKQLQRSGETPTFTPTQTVGVGPIKITFDFGAALPIRASNYSSSNSTLPVFITVEDQGQGLFGDVPAKALLLKVPDSFVLATCPKFSFDSNEGGYNIYKNSQSITMIKKKSTQLRCSFTVPREDQVVVEKTYFLSANMSYNYSLTSEVDVSVNPTLTA